MKKIALFLIVAVAILNLSCTQSYAITETHGVNGKVSGKSIGAGALSLLIWPGLGQILNNQKDDKVITHALLGLTGVFRFWSCYDAVVDRNGGVWHSRI